jgi:Mn2+/Fe2+ NRAMP family transporter
MATQSTPSIKVRGGRLAEINSRRRGRVRSFFANLGPGLITGAADDDPSGISTYSTAGSGYGFGLLWTAALSLPLMSSVQLMCARIGLVSGRGLASVLRITIRGECSRLRACCCLLPTR